MGYGDIIRRAGLGLPRAAALAFALGRGVEGITSIETPNLALLAGHIQGWY